MSKATNDRAPPRSIAQLVRQLGYRHSSWQVFTDFVEMAAISVSNAVDLAQREPREARYLEIVRRYKPDEVQLFPQMLAGLILELEREPEDVLGRVFHELELHNKWTGQFFTPHPICQMMAKMIIGDGVDLQDKIAARGFVTASEPASGSGAMIIALAQELKTAGVNYQQHLHVTAVDIDPKCVHMTYLQFSLLHIPAVVVLGDTLRLDERSRWYTPAHIMGGWDSKLRQAQVLAEEQAPEERKPERPADPDTSGSTRKRPSQLTLF